MSQEIQADTKNTDLTIKIYDLPGLSKSQIKELINCFTVNFSNITINHLEITIIAVPLGWGFNFYLNFVKVGPMALCSTTLGLEDMLFETLSSILIFWGKRMERESDNRSSLEEIDEEIDSTSTDVLTDDQWSSPLPEKVNIDQLLKEFEADRKRRKEKS